MAEFKPQHTPFVKQLAANDRPTRDKAVASLHTYLSSSARVFTKPELLKLWKGLFYTMWMSDRPRTQQHLAADLSNLVTPLSEANFVTFMDAFWSTMAREWGLIDVLRMDKFLLLVRRYLAAEFRYLEKRGWEEGLVGEVLEGERVGVLNPTDAKIPTGLRFHIFDIYIDELEKLKPMEMKTPPPLDTLLSPFEELAKNSPTKLIRTKAKDLLCDDRLKTWGYSKAPGGKIEGEAQDKESGGMEVEDEEWGGIED